MDSGLTKYFYNMNYNYGSEDGKSKYVWGVILVNDTGLEDIMGFFKKHYPDSDKMYNMNLTAFNKL